MINGKVSHGLEAIIRLTILGPTRRRRIRALIDTGFDGWLSLPSNIILELGLGWRRRGLAMLADGSESVFDIFGGTVVWDRRRRDIPIDEAETTPLVGMSLLAGFSLNAQVRPAGKVTIKRLSH